jgi:hypothetical protein
MNALYPRGTITFDSSNRSVRETHAILLALVCLEKPAEERTIEEQISIDVIFGSKTSCADYCAIDVNDLASLRFMIQDLIGLYVGRPESTHIRGNYVFYYREQLTQSQFDNLRARAAACDFIALRDMYTHLLNAYEYATRW